MTSFYQNGPSIARSQGHSTSYTININQRNKQEVESASYGSTRSDLSEESKDVIIENRWAVLGRIGEGSFGEVFEAEDIYTFKRYAIKREPIKVKHPQIKHESDIYDILAGGPGIPQCHWHGQHGKFDCIVIDLLGPNLHQLKEVTQKFSVDIVIQFGTQMVSILEHIHKSGLVYGDIKPDNFLFPASYHLPEPEMIETKDENGISHSTYNHPTCEDVFRQWNTSNPQLFIVDFGLARWWRDPITHKPYPDGKRTFKNKTGTARYASLNVHRGKVHSRRDDIEGLGYLLLDMIFGTLPWTGIQARSSRAGWDRMKQIKQDVFLSDLCAGLPEGFLQYIEYSRKLRFIEEPNYQLLRDFLQGSLAGGRYSTIVKSPFGGHTERKWVQEIDKEVDPPTRAEMGRFAPKPKNQHYYEPPSEAFCMDTMNKDLPEFDDSSSFQKLVAKNRKKQKRIGWNSHRHDDAPWVPVTNWDTTIDVSQQQTNVSWGTDQAQGWGHKEEEVTWASTVVKPWD